MASVLELLLSKRIDISGIQQLWFSLNLRIKNQRDVKHVFK